jgi:hypothetical protein
MGDASATPDLLAEAEPRGELRVAFLDIKIGRREEGGAGQGADRELTRQWVRESSSTP